MLLHKDPAFTILFGDVHRKFLPANFAGKNLSEDSESLFNDVKKIVGCSSLTFLHQTHSIKGTALQSFEQAQQSASFVEEGDYLLTNVPGVGIAVATADCLPIILYDSEHHALSVIHAGWRGSCKQISVRALEHMRALFSTQADAIYAFLGPSARACCYEIGNDVLEILQEFSYKQEVVTQINNKYYLDVALMNKYQLLLAGVKNENIQLDYSLCTMCNESYCSHRRLKSPDRQMTVASLR